MVHFYADSEVYCGADVSCDKDESECEEHNHNETEDYNTLKEALYAASAYYKDKENYLYLSPIEGVTQSFFLEVDDEDEIVNIFIAPICGEDGYCTETPTHYFVEEDNLLCSVQCETHYLEKVMEENSEEYYGKAYKLVEHPTFDGADIRFIESELFDEVAVKCYEEERLNQEERDEAARVCLERFKNPQTQGNFIESASGGDATAVLLKMINSNEILDYQPQLKKLIARHKENLSKALELYMITHKERIGVKHDIILDLISD